MEHRFPVVLGKDYAGTVETAGEGVTSVNEGDEVFGVLMRDYIGDGTFADFVVVPEAIGLAKMPSGLDPAVAGALGLAGTTAHAAVEEISPSPGETVLISGATGGVGSEAIQLAVTRGRRSSLPRSRVRTSSSATSTPSTPLITRQGWRSRFVGSRAMAYMP